jgi:hypothetical protein
MLQSKRIGLAPIADGSLPAQHVTSKWLPGQDSNLRHFD